MLDGNTNNKTEDLGFTLEWGVQDWTDVAMGVREFVANAIDGCFLKKQPATEVEFDVVDTPRAKRDHTTVFIEYTPEIEKVHKNLSTMFLHFVPGIDLTKRIVPKRNENEIRIYKKGVLVSNRVGKSVFDYNLGEELELDESRNAKSWDVQYAVGQSLATANVSDLSHMLGKICEDSSLFEATIPSDYIVPTYGWTDEQRKTQKELYQRAWIGAVGEKGVATRGSTSIDSFVLEKGYVPKVVPSSWFTVLDRNEIKTERSVLTKSEADGKKVLPPTAEMQQAVDWAWALLDSFGMLNGKAKPNVHGFMAIMEGSCQTNGYYYKDEVFLHTALGGQQLYKVALEEVVHHVTGALDGSRDIQDLLFRLVTAIAM
jgi:hypothetical protein